MSLFISSLAYGVTFKVERIKGEITINAKPYTSKTILKERDTIKANGEKSLIQIRTNTGSVFVLKNGILKLTSFKKKSSEVKLESGFFAHFLKKFSKRKFTVKTSQSTFGVRGTKYLILAKKNKDYLCVCEGEVFGKSSYSNKTYYISKNEDLSFNYKFKKSHKMEASKQMLNMTIDTFKDMGVWNKE